MSMFIFFRIYMIKIIISNQMYEAILKDMYNNQFAHSTIKLV
jgi:hypothetical protein